MPYNYVTPIEAFKTHKADGQTGTQITFNDSNFKWYNNRLGINPFGSVGTLTPIQLLNLKIIRIHLIVGGLCQEVGVCNSGICWYLNSIIEMTKWNADGYQQLRALQTWFSCRNKPQTIMCLINFERQRLYRGLAPLPTLSKDSIPSRYLFHLKEESLQAIRVSDTPSALCKIRVGSCMYGSYWFWSRRSMINPCR